METRYSKGRAKSMSEADANGKAWEINTWKVNGAVVCQATECTVSDGMVSTDLFGAKLLKLASEEGIATEKRIASVHAAGLAEFEKLAKDFKPVYEIKIGQIIFTDGPFDSRKRAVYEIERPGRYKTVHLDGEGFDIDEHVNPISAKFGIGSYYKEGETIPAEEVAQLVEVARESMAKKNAEEEQAKEQANAKLEKAKAEGVKLLPSLPAGAVAIICAHLEENTSDPMSDYFGSHTTKTVYLAFSTNTKDMFAEMRQAARNFEETVFLAEGGPEVEHREKYSMGHGYYLGTSRYSGWQVNKTNIGGSYGVTLERLQIAIGEGRYFCDRSPIAAEVEAVTPPTGGHLATCKFNRAKNGIELYFPGKPSASVLSDLKANGWKWGKFNKCWYSYNTEKAQRFAAKYAEVKEESTISQDGLLVEAQESAYVDNEARRMDL